ncbi:MAG: DedA family protein [Thermomicrobiales bacterium]
MRFLSAFSQMALALFAAYEFPTLFGLILIEEMGVPLPLPGDVLIAYAGGRAGRTPLDAIAVIGTVALATALGSSLLFLFARRCGPAMIGRAHRVLHLRPARVARVQVWFRERGAVAIVLGRLIPGLRTPTSVMAGLAHVPYRVFAPSTMLAAIIWATFYYYAGNAVHRLWSPLTRWAGEDPEQAVSTLVFAVGLAVAWRWLRQRNGMLTHRHMDRLTP